MRLVLKILLLVVIVATALLFAVALFFVLVIQKRPFVIEMLALAGVSLLGFLSAWFHIKTIKLYKLDNKNQLLPQPSKTFWTLNIAFAGALMALFSWAFYSIIESMNQFGDSISSRDLMEMVLVFLIPLSISAFIALESYYLKRMLKKNIDRKLILEIDDIKGEL